MRTITKEVKINLYKFEELSEEVQEKIKQDYTTDKESNAYIFTENVNEQLHHFFPNSEIEVQYDFGYCQGDGLNFYGELYFKDIFNAYKLLDSLKNPFTSDEEKTLEYISKFIDTVYLKENQNYTYSLIDQNDFFEQITESYMLDFDNPKTNYCQCELIKKLDKEIKKIFDSLIDFYYKAGEKYFYEVTEDDIEDDEYFQGYFTKDGSRYYNIDIND